MFLGLKEAIQKYEVDLEDVAWTPNPGPQRYAIACPVYEVFYGGSRGGGKSDWLLGDYAKNVNKWGRAWRGILFRKTYGDLEDLIRRSMEIYYRAFPGALYSITAKTWLFPSGATLKFRYADKDKDILHYKGPSYAWIGLDELTDWPTPFVFDTIKGSARSPEGAPVRIRATGNPGGPGHHWVKARFIDEMPPLQVFADPEEEGLERVFIPARVEDNPYWEQKDPDYIRRLDAIADPALKRAWRWGDWDAFVGQVFEEFRRNIHVIEPFEIPKEWHRFVACDWGYARPFSFGWYAVDGDGRAYRYREWYGMVPRKPDTGIRLVSSKAAKRIKDIETEAGERIGKKCSIYDRVLSPDCFRKEGHTGPTIAEEFSDEGVYFRRADDSRIQGLEQCHLRLQVPEDYDRDRRETWPMFVVFNTCVHWIRTVPILDHDEIRPEDVNKQCEDHAYEEWRYGMMSRPIRTPEPKGRPGWRDRKRRRKRPSWKTA